VPDVLTHNAAANTCEKGMQWERALGVLQKICEALLEVNVMSCTSAMSACDKGAQ